MTNKTLLIVDDELNVLSSLKRELRHDYVICSATSGKKGLCLLKEHDVGVVISDQMMPEMDGVTFLELVKIQKPDVVRILLTGYASMKNAVDAINHSNVFEYLTKPWKNMALKESLNRAFEHYNLITENRRLEKQVHDQNAQLKLINKNLDELVKQRTFQLDQAVKEGIVMLAIAAEAKDDDTGNHVNRIKDMTCEICSGFGMNEKESEEIGCFSIMHDVGKIHVPDDILKKPGRLTDDEWIIMKYHTIAGEKILGTQPFYQTAREIARWHHERWDGTGYPDGLKGEEIPLPARIVTVADIFDALIHKRPYKPAWPKEKAVEEMKKQSGKIFDPTILKVFLKITGD